MPTKKKPEPAAASLPPRGTCPDCGTEMRLENEEPYYLGEDGQGGFGSQRGYYVCPKCRYREQAWEALGR
jgi:ssDNA-binding Zn-finger/Zn-ribbon topoisomerase 1